MLLLHCLLGGSGYGMGVESVRHSERETVTHLHTNKHRHSGAHIATCIISNSTQRFKWFVLHTFYTILFITILFLARVCAQVFLGGWREYVRSILCVHLFRLCLYTVRIMHSSAMVCHGMRLKYVAGVHEYATAIDGDIMRFHIHIFCKTNENILMSSLNIT